MKTAELLKSPTYTPEKLLDYLIKTLGLKNDAALSKALKVAPPVISKIRNRKLHVGPAILIRMLEKSPFSLHYLKALAGI